MMALIEKFPFKIALVVYAASLYFRFDAFESDPTSPYVMGKANIVAADGNQKQLVEKVKAANDFLRSLEVKRAEVQALARQLSEMKNELPETLDTGSFVKNVVGEAGRVGLRVVSFKPKQSKKEEYYAEQSFELAFHGVYAQLVVLFERLNSMPAIVHIDDFSLKRDGSPVSPYVELDGVMELKAYHYVGSRADEVANNNASAPRQIPAPAPVAPAAPAAPVAPAAPAAAPAAPQAAAPTAPAAQAPAAPAPAAPAPAQGAPAAKPAAPQGGAK